MFDKADVNDYNKLDFDEYKVYYKNMEDKLRADMGGAYTLTEEQLRESFDAHDVDKSGYITKDEVM